MLKILLGEIVDAEPAFAQLDKLSTEGKLNFQVTYKTARIIKKIQPELKDFYEEKQNLLNKFGTKVKDEKGNDTDQYHVENIKEYTKYLKQLYEVEVELFNIFPFTKDELDKVTGLSVDNILKLGKFILEDNTVEEEKERKPIKLNLE